ncbi:MAG: ATP-binding cassette domain-containing protein [Vicinamibacteria bacterium]|nr:ATP-binding cassette domain-containing protein [Vicinamibacteria bacterium]
MKSTPILDVRRLAREFSVPAPTAGEGVARWRPFRGRTGTRTFRALDDVSFTVHPGEVVGLIGRNGAGKSTLLRVLARLLLPTLGEVDIDGRVGSLLEIGSGFHPDLSGLENVYLNGALLGLSRATIDRQLGQIVDFAEIGDFVHAPVKHYSSGMYLRLAFSVAVHLEAELLLVDEVFSVGDAWFARKCRERLLRTCRASRAVLIVGHDLEALCAICSRLLLLEAGRLVADGPPREVAARYLAAGAASGSSSGSGRA